MMKGRMMVFLLISFLLLFGGTASASERLDHRQGDYLVHYLEDGDGTKQIFSMETGNHLTASNTKIHVFINAQELDSSAYTVDYDNHTIMMHKVPDSGAELSMKYAIAPAFEWEEGVSGTASIGHALSAGEGNSRTFKVTSRYTLNSSKNVSLYIDGNKLRASEFKFDHKTLTVTLSEKRKAPGKQSKIYFYFPKTSVSGTVQSNEETDPKPSTGSDATPTPEPDTEAVVEFNVPSGENFPGTIALTPNYTFTVSTTAEMRKSGFATYAIIKNASGELVKRIRVDGGHSSTYSLRKLGLPEVTGSMAEVIDYVKETISHFIR